MIAALLLCLSLFTAGFAADLAILSDAPSRGPAAYGLQRFNAMVTEAGLRPVQVAAQGKARPLLVVGIQGKGGLAEKLLGQAKIAPEKHAEGFVLAKVKPQVVVCLGADETGTMYGLFELAERIQNSGVNALDLKQPVRQAPLVQFRATNPFLCVQFEPDKPWWFQNKDYWIKLLDLMAISRLNWIDLHGMYDIHTTFFPNIYPYFVKSDTFPGAGLPPEQAAKNLAMLKWVIAQAHKRGIKFALMSYHTSWNGPYLPKAPYPETEENLVTYTRECVRNLLRACPELDMIGFRIGESGRSEDFFEKSYLQGIDESGVKSIKLYTRTWGAQKPKILEIGRRYPGKFYIEIKYNGEQYGLPYQIAGGRMSGWKDYSYRSYFTWPQEYKVIWQLRYNGTHRLYRWGNIADTRRTARTVNLAGAYGICIEPVTAYYPQDDYFHKASIHHDYFDWGYQRDWFWYVLWGRLLYNPDVPDSTFVRMFQRRFGQSKGLYALAGLNLSSKIIPNIYRYHCYGPDHRNMAPEYETGGDLDTFATLDPFDTFVMKSPSATVWQQLNGVEDARKGPDWFAHKMLLLAQATDDMAEQLKSQLSPGDKHFKELQCLVMDWQAQASFARYYAWKVLAGYQYTLFVQTGDLAAARSALDLLEKAHKAWWEMCKVQDVHYKPFIEKLRMHTDHFSWSAEGKQLANDAKPLERALADLESRFAPADKRPLFASINLTTALAAGEPVSFTLTVGTKGKVNSVKVHFKLPGSTGWQVRNCKPIKGFEEHAFSYDMPKPGKGGALEYYFTCQIGSHQWRYPEKGVLSKHLSWDTKGPELELVRASELMRKGGTRFVRIVAKASDPSGLREVQLAWKPFPSDNDWRYKLMTPKQGFYVAEFPLTAEGAMYALRAVDKLGHGTMWPDFEVETPYKVIAPWPAPARGTLDASALLEQLPAKHKAAERFALLVAGRGATILEHASQQVKSTLLDLVQRGATLVIFNQDLPSPFLDWLPGGIGSTDDDFDSATVVQGSPLTKGLPEVITGPKMVNDTLVPKDGWQGLTDPCALAMLKYGKGYIILIQLRVDDFPDLFASRQLMSNIVALAHAKGKPGLIIDAGNGRGVVALSRQGVDFWTLDMLK